jgi:hypothetical protein
MMRLSTEFQDSQGTRLSVRIEHEQSRERNCWRVYAQHSVDGKGASFETRQERVARNRFAELEQHAIRVGWKLKVVLNSFPFPAPMLIGPDGRHLFRDHNTGEYHTDDSAFRPLSGAGPYLDDVDRFSVVFAPRS